MKQLRSVFLVAILLLGTVSAHALDSDHFPVDEAMRKRVNFWKKVYTEISSDQAYLHDADDLTVIYKTISVKGLSRRGRVRKVRREKKKIKAALRQIIRKRKQGLTDFESQLVERMGDDTDLSRIRRLARRVRFQRGMSNRYYEGLERSYLYLDEIKKIFREKGLPVELAYLPHVESSFNYRAYSKVGAAGIWQFMRSTARLYRLKLSYIVDQRRDPIKATHAAARLLSDNYRRLKAWPLALTAYNHGAASIDRAVRKVGTRDISKIIQKYKGRRFGFASKNFYASFVAASEIAEDPSEHFDRLPPVRKRPENSRLLLKHRMTMRQVSRTLGIKMSTLKRLNRSLRPAAFRSHLYLPRNFELGVPLVSQTKLDSFRQKLAALKGPKKLPKGGFDHVISRGESLFMVARMYRVSLSDLIMVNQIAEPSRVRPGMRIKIPGKGGAKIAQKSLSRVSKPKILGPIRPELLAKANQPEKTAEPPVVEEAKEEASPVSVLAAFKNMISPSSFDRLSVGQAKVAQKEDVRKEKARDIDVSSYHLQTKEVRPGLYQIFVESDETLGHYADWSLVPMRRIAAKSRMGGRAVRLGQKVRIPMSKERLMQFNLKRVEYHLAIEEDFYSNYRIAGQTERRVRRGETLDRILRRADIPYWLFRKFQPEGFSPRLVVGQRLIIPDVEVKSATEQD